ncbi:hypothetical protein BH762_gp047 [Gordonia phage OneUp]|uniref:Uncharacterized protein n=1 Tax=Gordonia phage OneUp TaxID=1838074 RepID=A0A160DF14_9CAUD|nr:hypothetical protein BH762_gp047 [Gordonia phage OneUp]ANA86471.1 hypothetical protein PBI_ONEUP_138 [Gordonia phage OneUp]
MRIVYQVPDPDLVQDFTLVQEYVVEDATMVPRIGDKVEIGLVRLAVDDVVWELGEELENVEVVLKPPAPF